MSDTALMTAGCRAIETARPDGLVRDPFAARLAGERGMAIARGLSGLEIMCIGVGVRTRFLDDLVLEAVHSGRVETVVSIGAGLDTRPWRLDLPAALRWIEVDFEDMLEYKARILGSDPPACRLERLAADLNLAAERQAVFDTAGAAPGLMITEGLLMYLPADTVEALASGPAMRGGLRYWLLDVISVGMAKVLGMSSRFPSIENVRAASYLAGGQILDLAARHGWTRARRRSYISDFAGVAGKRVPPPPPGFLPPPESDPSGVHLLARG